jgi:SAM-dependent methyltransferase
MREEESGTNGVEALDLYARVEDLLGVHEAAPRLYAHYLLALQETEFGTLLDVGCGSGEFIRQIAGAFPDARFTGIDLSPEMVRQAREKGIDARCVDLCDVEGRFDVITCVFDMLNYLSPEELPGFMRCLATRLRPGGLLLCDLNTLHGFETVAVGAFSAEDPTRFVAIESDFEAGVYTADFTLFEKEKGECWKKNSRRIRQYLHTPENLAELGGLELLERREVNLYDEEEADKEFLIFGRYG